MLETSIPGIVGIPGIPGIVENPESYPLYNSKSEFQLVPVDLSLVDNLLTFTIE